MIRNFYLIKEWKELPVFSFDFQQNTKLNYFQIIKDGPARTI